MKGELATMASDPLVITVVAKAFVPMNGHFLRQKVLKRKFAWRQWGRSRWRWQGMWSKVEWTRASTLILDLVLLESS